MIERVRTRTRSPERIAAMGGKSMSLVMPELNQKVPSRRDDIIRGLRRIVPGEGVITAATELGRTPPDSRVSRRVFAATWPADHGTGETPLRRRVCALAGIAAALTQPRKVIRNHGELDQ